MASKTGNSKRKQSPAKQEARKRCRTAAKEAHLANKAAQEAAHKENLAIEKAGGMKPWDAVRAARKNSPQRRAKQQTWLRQHPIELIR